VTAPCPLPDLPQNAGLLVFLRGQASLPRLKDGFDDYGGFELHSHPDLISRLEQLPIPPLTDTGWHALSAWQSDLPSAQGVQRLSALTRAALDYARDLATP